MHNLKGIEIYTEEELSETLEHQRYKSQLEQIIFLKQKRINELVKQYQESYSFIIESSVIGLIIYNSPLNNFICSGIFHRESLSKPEQLIDLFAKSNNFLKAQNYQLNKNSQLNLWQTLINKTKTLESPLIIWHLDHNFLTITIKNEISNYHYSLF